MTSILLASVFATPALAFLIQRFLFSRTSFPNIRGPPHPSWLWGNEWEIFTEPKKGRNYLEWDAQFGAAYKIKLMLGRECLVIRDPRAINHVLGGKPYSYRRQSASRKIMERMLGRGILVVEGPEHQKARRALQPAFNPTAIRSYTNIFQDSVTKVAAAFEKQIEEQGGTSATIDVADWAFRLALDNIGIAGFSFSFSALSGYDTPLVKTLRELGEGGKPLPFFLATALSRPFPFILDVPTPPVRMMKGVRGALDENTRRLLEEARKGKREFNEHAGGNEPEKPSALKLLVESEMGRKGEVPLTEDEIVAQASSLLFAGSETVAISLTWILHTLAHHQPIQARLRQELSALPDEPPYDTLSAEALPYLEAVIKESNRVNHVFTELLRVAEEDDFIPLSTPITSTTGTQISSIPIKRGSFVVLPNVAFNRSPALWGHTAGEFKPERWLGDEKTGAALEEVRSVYGGLYTFGVGPKACLGYAFAITEMKVTLVHLIRHFEFHPSEVESEEAHFGIVHRLRRKGDGSFNVMLQVRKVAG